MIPKDTWPKACETFILRTSHFKVIRPLTEYIRYVFISTPISYKIGCGEHKNYIIIA